jgi:exoribonuclease-2
MPVLPPPGSVVAWWNEGELQCAVLAGEEKRRLRLVDTGGREVRANPSRIAVTVERGGAAPGKSPEELREAGERAASLEAHVRRLADGCEVALVWELANEEPGSYPVAALAELAFGDGGGAEQAALMRALQIDRIHFARKGEVWEPRSAEAVERLLREQRRTAERAARKERLFRALGESAGGAPFEPSGDETERRYLAALEEFALRDFEASEAARGLALEAVQAAGVRADRPHEAAFKLLRRLGRFTSDDENLEVLRHGLRRAFPDEVHAHAVQVAATPFDGSGRTDLAGLETVTIDSEHTQEIDDALSLEPVGAERWRLGVHIADPASRIAVDDPVDVEALTRGITHYLPDRRILMLPEPISEDAASLLVGQERPALSFVIELSGDGELHAFEVARSVIRPRARLSYEEADRAIADTDLPHGAMLATLDRLTAALARRRVEAGAVRMVTPEVDVHVDAAGRASLERHPAESASRRVVSEAMVLAGTLAARLCVERELPVIFRRQPASDPPIEPPPDGLWDPVSAFRARRRMRRGEVGIEPGSHYGLGLDAYVQVTSPLRRYQDLVVHRQLSASVAEREPPYDREAIQRIAATTERAELVARRIERASNRYWLLRYLQQQRTERVAAVVLAVEPRTFVQLEETLIEQPLPSLKGVEPGQRLELRVQRVNPRADLLSLRG